MHRLVVATCHLSRVECCAIMSCSASERVLAEYRAFGVADTALRSVYSIPFDRTAKLSSAPRNRAGCLYHHMYHSCIIIWPSDM